MNPAPSRYWRLLRRLLAALALAAGLFVPGSSAVASALRVTPIRIELQPDKRFCALTLANDGDLPVSVQVRGFRWSRGEQGEDLLEPVAGFSINPTIVTLAGQETRLIRCSLPAAEGAAEQTWRLLFDELATPDTPVGPGEIRTLLRISVPIFRAPRGAEPALDWTVRHDPGGGIAAVIVNRGQRHVRVLSISMTATSGETVHLDRGGYILAGGCLAFPLPPSFPVSIAELRVQTDEGNLIPTRLAEATGTGQ